MGFSFPEIRHMVKGRLMDLIACHQIKNEGAKIDMNKVEAIDSTDVFPNWR